MTNACPITSVKNVPVQIGGNVLVGGLGHNLVPRSYISEHKIKEISIEKYKSSGTGITFKDIKDRFLIKKPQAQRSLKHFHAKGILFTAEDLINHGICPIKNTSPQQYYPACIKADIIQDLEKRKNVLVEATGVGFSKLPISKGPLASCLEPIIINQTLEGYVLPLLPELRYSYITCISRQRSVQNAMQS